MNNGIFRWITLASVLLLAGCTGLQAPKVDSVHLYALDAQAASPPQHKIPATLAISLPTAWPGYDTPQIVYQRQPLELEHFVTHRWADTPARMLRPLLARALEPAFQAVIQTPGAISADYRLDTELIRLQQNFTSNPSQVQLVLRAQLIDLKDQRVLAVKRFDESENSATEDAYGGVVAANRALQRVLQQLAEFCLHASASH